ncbi:MAG TPA: hypothetical protein VGH95_07965 [Candidatus Aquirickettsiella sp.]
MIYSNRCGHNQLHSLVVFALKVFRPWGTFLITRKSNIALIARIVNALTFSYNALYRPFWTSFMNRASRDSSDKDKIVRLCFDTPVSLRKALKLQAARDDKEMKEALHELIQGYVDGKFKLD